TWRPSSITPSAATTSGPDCATISGSAGGAPRGPRGVLESPAGVPVGREPPSQMPDATANGRRSGFGTLSASPFRTPWHRHGRVRSGWWEEAEIHSYAVRRVLRNACLGLLAFVLMAATWSVASPARSTLPLVAVAGYQRESGLARFRPLAAIDALTGVTVVIDGIALATDAQPGETAGGLLRTAGVEVSSGDRLSVPAEQPLVAGLRIELTRGYPVTVVDGGIRIAFRAQPGSVAAFL